MGRATITAALGPCRLHLTHSPITIINEKHHPFPQGWQRLIWGHVRDDRTFPVCATVHNSIHFAQDRYDRYGWPSWMVARTRDLGEFAIAAREHARAGATDLLPWPAWMGTPL